ncbi:MAG: phytanoyl-CoA dioxygenase family protein [Planctomycetota bacterium]
MQPTVGRPPLDFERSTLPWLDRIRLEIDDYVRQQPLPPAEQFKLRGQLFQWMLYGYATLEQAVEHELIDALLADVEELLAHNDRYSVKVLSNEHNYVPINQVQTDDLWGKHARLVCLHNASIAAKKISLHRNIVQFLQHLFREEVALMATLTFFEGSEQLIHQDHSYVVAAQPSHLAATWVALEDISPDAGPLAYYPGSHATPKFDWGDGLFRTPNSTGTDQAFGDHIHATAKEYGLTLATFAPRKGDVFVWHGALAHGGSPVRDRSLTRKSHVTHYSTSRTLTYDFRDPGVKVQALRVNGGVVYRHPTDPAQEDVLRAGAHF